MEPGALDRRREDAGLDRRELHRCHLDRRKKRGIWSLRRGDRVGDHGRPLDLGQGSGTVETVGRPVLGRDRVESGHQGVGERPTPLANAEGPLDCGRCRAGQQRVGACHRHRVRGCERVDAGEQLEGEDREAVGVGPAAATAVAGGYGLRSVGPGQCRASVGKDEDRCGPEVPVHESSVVHRLEDRGDVLEGVESGGRRQRRDADQVVERDVGQVPGHQRRGRRERVQLVGGRQLGQQHPIDEPRLLAQSTQRVASVGRDLENRHCGCASLRASPSVQTVGPGRRARVPNSAITLLGWSHTIRGVGPTVPGSSSRFSPAATSRPRSAVDQRVVRIR